MTNAYLQEVQRQAAGIEREPEHPGETMAEYRERKAKLYRVLKVAAGILTVVGLLVAMWVTR